MSIFITGDIHADPTRFSTEIFPEQKEMTRDDVVIICGDFGLVWDKIESKREKHWLKWLGEKPFTLVFVDGNHENFSRLNSLPTTIWHGGKVHQIRENIFHLMRGEIFNIDGQKFFVFGGARSHDIVGVATKEELKLDYSAGILYRNDPMFKIKKKYIDEEQLCYRIAGETWWKEEMPTKQEMDHGMENLQKNNMKVDFIISHDGPASDLALLGGGTMNIDPLNKYFETIKQTVSYRSWIFGHHHINRRVDEKDFALFEQIIQIG